MKDTFKQGLIRVEIRGVNAAGQVQIGLLCTGGDGRGFWTLPKDIIDASMVRISEKHTEDAIPVDWIRKQAEEFPGMESAMWDKLIRLWKTKIACEELYISSNHKKDVPDTNVGDTISRQQAIDAISCDITITGRRNAEIVSATIAQFVDRIKALPPAMSDGIMLSIGEDGIARTYDDTYDITIHCESREKQEEVREALEGIPRWILCSERMPEEHEWIGTKRFGTTISDEVYVTFENPEGERFCKHLSFQNGELSAFDKSTIDAFYKGSKPIAWMPLPEPYKGMKE